MITIPFTNFINSHINPYHYSDYSDINYDIYVMYHQFERHTTFLRGMNMIRHQLVDGLDLY